MIRTRVKGNGKPRAQAACKSEDARSFQQLQSESVDSPDNYEEDIDSEGDRGIDDDARQISTISSNVIPASFKDELFDEELNAFFSETETATRRQNCAYAEWNGNQRDLEPLPMYSAGILDEPGNISSSELAEFGQLLDRLM